MTEGTCCFIGHRKIAITDKLKQELYNIIENLIIFQNIDTFLFGSNSEFDDLCHEITSQIKEKYQHKAVGRRDKSLQTGVFNSITAQKILISARIICDFIVCSEGKTHSLKCIAVLK